jgi:hypothetical protein
LEGRVQPLRKTQISKSPILDITGNGSVLTFFTFGVCGNHFAPRFVPSRLETFDQLPIASFSVIVDNLRH